MTAVAIGDYLIVRGEKNRKHLARAITVAKDQDFYPVKVEVADASMADKDTRIELEVSFDDTIINLGQNPPPGSAYGVRIEPYKDRSVVPSWGTVLYFTKLSAADRAELEKLLTSAALALKKQGLFVYGPVLTHIRPPRGRTLGHFIQSRGGAQHVNFYVPPSLVELADIPALIYHEMGHAIWSNQMSRKFKAKWVRLYHEHVDANLVTANRLTSLIEDMKAATNLKVFKKSVGEDDQWLFGSIMGWILDVHKLRVEDLQVLLEEDGNIERFLPNARDHKFILSDVEIPVTDYAAKNVEETWCESFSHYMTDKKLPKPFKKLLAATIEKCANVSLKG